jgi:hypothetical protein
MMTAISGGRAMVTRSHDEGYAAPAPTGVAGVEILPGATRRISWGAVFAGVVLVLAVQLLLSLLGLGVGLGTVSPTAGDTPRASTLGIGAGVWWAVSYLIALFVGGYVAARLAGRLVGWDGALHGILTWAFALLVSFYLVTTAIGSVIGGALSAVSSTLSAAGQTVKEAVPPAAQAAGITPDAIQQKAQDLLSAQPAPNADPKTMSREEATKEIASNLPKLAQGGPAAQPARDRIVDIVAAQANISREEANQRLDQLQAQATQTKDQAVDKAKQAADQTASGLSKASLIGFAALLLGAGAAGFGGHLGARRRDGVAPA